MFRFIILKGSYKYFNYREFEYTILNNKNKSEELQ